MPCDLKSRFLVTSPQVSLLALDLFKISPYGDRLYIHDGKESLWCTEYVGTIDIGLMASTFEGFRPSHIVPDLTSKLRTLSVVSNGALYQVGPNGEMINLGRGSIPDFDSLKSEPKRRVYLTFYAITAIVVCIVGWLSLRYRRQRSVQRSA